MSAVVSDAPRETPPARPATSDRAGLLAIDKPAGITSHDVVEIVRRRLGIKRAGHLGTLDPGATGLLLVATGAATRAIPAWQGGDKTYDATLRFGVTTDTQDVHGTVLERRDAIPDAAAARAAALEMVGEIDQVPPMVSALKVQGERLYRLARRGVEVERKPRRITVESWEWQSFEGATASFRVVCSAGTYVRTLIHDLGQRLGSGAALERLRRIRSEPFGLERSIDVESLRRIGLDAVWERAGWSLDRALEHLPRLALSDDEAAAIGFGARPTVSSARLEPGVAVPAAANAGRSIVLVGPDGGVLALGEVAESAPGALEIKPRVVFPWATREGRPR